MEWIIGMYNSHNSNSSQSYDCRSEILILQNFIKKYPDMKKYIDPVSYFNQGGDNVDINRLTEKWMDSISHYISSKKRTLEHMPDTSSFDFGPTIHLHPQQQDSKEWLEMRNMVLERTKQFSKKRKQSQKIKHSPESIIEICTEDPSEIDTTGLDPIEIDETELLVYNPEDVEVMQKKKRRRRKHKK